MNETTPDLAGQDLLMLLQSLMSGQPSMANRMATGGQDAAQMLLKRRLGQPQELPSGRLPTSPPYTGPRL